MSNKKDFYEVLGLSKTTTADEIKKAYRKLANQYHPDKNLDDPSSEEKFKEVKHAYEILSDESTRASYDQFGHGGVDRSAGRQHQDAYAESFKRAFAEQMRQQRTMQVQVGITLMHSIKGGPVTVDVPGIEECGACAGTGSKTKSKTPCNGCGGAGHSTGQVGGMRFSQVCGMCGGAGQIVTDPCDTCHGAGQVRKNDKREIDVPAGVNTGDAIRMGFTEYEVVFIFVVLSHPIFVRDGNDLIRGVEVDAVTATLGGKVSVEDVFGSSLVVTIPAGTQPNQSLRLSGKGVSRNGQLGNMYCQILVKIPTTLTQQQKELYQQLQNMQAPLGDNNAPS